jgi:hypothetical protein
MTKRLAAGAIAAVLGLIAIATLASPAQAQAGTGTVSVVHGIPGVTVDVYVDDVLTLPAFAPGTVAGPLTLPAATYSIEIFAAGADPATASPVITASVALPAGADASLVANLDASGTPVLNTFVNDTAAAPAGQGRLVVRHTAAAPAVDVLAGATPVFTDLTNPNSVQADLPAGTVSASVNLAGTATTVIGPAPVTVEAGMATIVYAIGSAEDQTLGVVVQMVPLAGPQLVVQTGTSGLQDQSGAPLWAVAALVVALSGLAVAGRRVVLARG